MPPNVSGLSFGGNVWGYGSVEAFKSAYAEIRHSSGNGAGAVAPAPKKAPKEPVDTGLTRYLGSAGCAEQKLAHLHDINMFVEDFRLGSASGELPETQELNELKNLSKYLSPETLAEQVLEKDGGVDGIEKDLAQMLEKKLLAARQKSAAGAKAPQLSAEDRKRIDTACHTALAKTFQAYTLERLSTFTTKDRQLELATADKNAILNTALGVAELLKDGRISENSVVTLLRDGSLVDLANTLDVTRLLQKAAERAKEQFTQKADLLAAAQNLSPAEQKAIEDVIKARERFTQVLDFKISERDPSGKLSDAKFQARQLQEVKLRLQQFRYDLERCTGRVGLEFGHGKYSFYGVMEQLRRACSNLKGDRHLDARFKTDAARDQAFSELLAAAGRLPLAALPSELKTTVADRAAKACATTHAANDGARMSQDTAAVRRNEDAYARKVLDLLHKTGGMQMTRTEISASAVAEIGNPALASGQVAAGGFYRTSAAVVATKGGGYALVLSKEGGGRVSASSEAVSGAEAKVNVEGGGGKETVLAFANQDELIAYCRQNCPKLLSSIPGSFTDVADRTLRDAEAIPRLKKSIRLVGVAVKAGKFLGNVTGLRIHKTKSFTEVNFEKRMRDAGVFENLDGILFRRRNGLAVSRTVSTTASGAATGGATVDVGTDAAGAKLDTSVTLGGKTRKIKTKGLQTIRSFVAMHTAEEMRQNVLPGLFDDYRQYQKTAPDAYGKSKVADELDAFATAEPPAGASPEARAKFWLGRVTELSAKYRALEGACSAPGGGKKEVRARQIDFARQTRLYAAVNEYVAKRIESELRDVQSPAATAALSSALKVARESLGATLARSNIVLRPDIVQEHLQFGREVSGGKSREFYVKAEVGWDVGIGTAESSSESSESEAANAAVSMFKDAFLDAMGTLKADGEKALKGLMGLSGKVTGTLTTTTYANRGDAVKPWENANAVKIDLDVSYPLGPLSLIQTVVKLVEKAKAEPPANESRTQMLKDVAKGFAVEFGKQLGAAALTELDKAAAALVSPVTSLPMTALVNGVTKALEKVGVSLGLSKSDATTKGGKLSLVFTDKKLTQCKMSDYVRNNRKLAITAKAAGLPVGLSFDKTDTVSREQVTFDLMPHATFGTLLSGGGLVFMRGPAKAVEFLVKNQKAANEVVASLRKTKEPGKVAYADAQLQAICDGLEKLQTLSDATDAKVPAGMKKAARDVLGKARGAWADVAKDPSATETDAARNDLLANLAVQLVKGYELLASAQQLGWTVPK